MGVIEHFKEDGDYHQGLIPTGSLEQIVIQFIIAHPAISIGKLETQAGMKRTTLANAVKGRRKITKKYLPFLVQILKGYGMVI